MRKNSRPLLPNIQQAGLVKGFSLEIKTTIDPETSDNQTIRFRSALSPAEYLLVGYDQEQGRLVVDCRSAGGALNSFPAVFSPKENIESPAFLLMERWLRFSRTPGCVSPPDISSIGLPVWMN